MTNNKKLYGFIIIIFIILAGITAFLVYFAYNITQFTTYGTNTSIGSVYVGGLFGDEAKQKVTSACVNWQKTAKVRLVYQDYELVLDNNEFVCDVNRSVSIAESGKTTTLFINMGHEDYINNVIIENMGQLKYTSFKFDNIENSLLSQVSLLYTDIRIDIGKFTNEYENNIGEIGRVEIIYDDAEFLSTRINHLLNTIKITENQQFNLKEYVENNYAEENITLTYEELNILSSGIFQLILDTNFYNIEKHTSPTVPSFTVSGYEALIDENHDLSFFNPNPFPYYIVASSETRTVGNVTQNIIVFKLMGAPFIDEISHRLTTSVMQQGDIYWYYEEWMGQPVGTTPILAYPGYEGYRTFVVREIKTMNDERYETIISEDIYMPKENIYIKRP